METFISLLQNFGFPIAGCVAMFIMLHNEQKAHKEETSLLSQTITDLKIEFKDAMNQLKSDTVTAINNNTLVMQKLLDKLEDTK